MLHAVLYKYIYKLYSISHTYSYRRHSYTQYILALSTQTRRIIGARHLLKAVHVCTKMCAKISKQYNKQKGCKITSVKRPFPKILGLL